MADTCKILVYHHKPPPTGDPIVRKGLGVMRHSELDSVLSQELETLQLGKKLIPLGASHIDITPRDLLTQDQLKTHARKPNDSSSIASVRVPVMVYLSRGYRELYIVSRKQEESPVEHALGKV